MIDPKHIISLSGRDYPTFAGILAEAHERGLQAIETELIQIPTTENEHTAIVKATVRMKDGTTFADYGDANPRNTNARIATALIRMASTRGKGRALRDAINVGQTMLEELPDLEEERGARRPAQSLAPERTAAGTTGSSPSIEGVEATWQNPKGRTLARKDLIAAMTGLVEQARTLGLPNAVTDIAAMTNADLYEVGVVLTTAIQEARAQTAEAAR